MKNSAEKRIEMVHFQITKGCNLRCWFCGQWGKKGFFADDAGTPVRLSEWKKVADELNAMCGDGMLRPFIMLWGGEPLTAPFFDELAEYLYTQKFKVGIVTNGTLIDKHSGVLNRCINRIYLSLDGPRALHDSVRGEGVFDRVTENVRKLGHGNVTVMSVMTHGLTEALPEFLDALEKLSIRELYLQDMIGLPHDRVQQYKNWMKNTFGIDAAYIDSWENNALEVFDTDRLLCEADLKKYSFEISCMRHGTDGGGYCLSPFRHAHIAWNGNVMYCTDFYDFSAGNIHNSALGEVFGNELSERFRAEIVNGCCAACASCSWRFKRDYLNG